MSSQPSGGGGSEALLGCLFGALYLVMGFVQMFAEIAGLQLALGLPWLLAAVVSLFTAFIPIVGTIAGIWGATTAWGWSFWSALALFFGYPILALAVAILFGVGGGVAELATRSFKKTKGLAPKREGGAL